MGIIIIPGQEPDSEPEPEVHTITPEDLEGMVREAIRRNKGTRRNHRSQELFDELVERLYDDGEIELAAAVLHLVSARVAGYLHLALEQLIQLSVLLAQSGALDRQCRVCGCTREHGCEGGCEWVEFDLCSRCAEKLRAASARATGLR